LTCSRLPTSVANTRAETSPELPTWTCPAPLVLALVTLPRSMVGTIASCHDRVPCARSVAGLKKCFDTPAHSSMYGRAELPLAKGFVSNEEFWPHSQIFIPGVLTLLPTRTTPS